MALTNSRDSCGFSRRRYRAKLIMQGIDIGVDLFFIVSLPTVTNVVGVPLAYRASYSLAIKLAKLPSSLGTAAATQQYNESKAQCDKLRRQIRYQKSKKTLSRIMNSQATEQAKKTALNNHMNSHSDDIKDDVLREMKDYIDKHEPREIYDYVERPTGTAIA